MKDIKYCPFETKSIQTDYNNLIVYEHKCPVCGMVKKSIREKELWPCGAEKYTGTFIKSKKKKKKKNKKPNTINRLKNFSKSAFKHVKTGRKKCTQEQIDYRFSICKDCPLFEIKNKKTGFGLCTHKDCGCNINTEKKFFNKLAWADQECPIKKWGPIEPD